MPWLLGEYLVVPAECKHALLILILHTGLLMTVHMIIIVEKDTYSLLCKVIDTERQVPC